MTNETANAGIAVTDKLCEEFSKELSQGQELWNQTLTWLTDKGLSFAVRSPSPPDAAHYALSPFPCLLEIQRKSNMVKRRPGVPLRALRKDLRRGFELWSRNHLLSSSAILPRPNTAIVATQC